MSAAAAAINEDKGATLEQINRTVQDINTAIQARKAQLAPQVKELRAARQAAQVLLCLPSPTVGSRLCGTLLRNPAFPAVLEGQAGLTPFIIPLSATYPTMCSCCACPLCWHVHPSQHAVHSAGPWELRETRKASTEMHSAAPACLAPAM